MLTRIVVDEPDPDNPDKRIYHVDEQFSRRCRHFDLPIEPEEWPIVNDAGEYVRSLAIMLGSHTGVERMTVQRHSVEVWKGGAYDWNDVEPLVLSAITAALGAFEGVPVYCRGRLEEKLNRLERDARKKALAEGGEPKPVVDPPQDHGPS